MTKGSIPTIPQGGSLESARAFGTDGIRGKVGVVITPELALQLGYWCGIVLPSEGPILIGQDSRDSGPMLTAALTAGLTAAGKEIWQLGICPTPAISFLIEKYNAAGGIMVSASHNPPEDNGIKVFNEEGLKISSKQKDIIEENLNRVGINTCGRGNNKNHGKVYDKNNLLIDYKESIINSIDKANLNDLSIVLDLCFGSATSCAKEIFQESGANLHILNGEANGSKINVNCGSTNIEMVRKVVLEKGADMGFAFDGDADRVIAIDNKGRKVDGDNILYLWGSELKEKNKLPDNRLVATVMSNLGFEKAWESKGGILERTPVGDQYVQSSMIKLGASLGGEQSGHIISSDHNFSGDGLLTALQIASICHLKGLQLSQWLDQSFTPFPQKLINLPIPNQNNAGSWKNCEPLQEVIFNAKAELGNDGRLLVRESGTEPLLRVMVEAECSSKVETLTSQITYIYDEHIKAA